MDETTTKENLTLREAGEVLGVTHKRVQGLIRQGQLGATLHDTPAGKYQTVRRVDVERLREERRKRAVGEDAEPRRGPAPRVKEGV